MLEPVKRSKELDEAVYDDWKHKQVDDAKKRAVAQYVDYETFKNMVSVAHLKPIGAEASGAGVEPFWRCNAFTFMTSFW